ncbi:hypothetical protein GCM10020001_053580 [Nonomuraea salmonea]
MIHTRGLTRDFKVKKETVTAVRGIDLDVEAGQLVAFLGPNGAGKSTTLRMLTTLLPPTSGTATVAGHDVAADPRAVRSRIGYVGQRNGAGEDQLVRDELVSQGRCYGLRPKEAGARADELLDLLELTPLAKRAPGTPRAASAAASTSRSASSTAPTCCSSTSPRRGSTPRAAPTSGGTSCGCARRTGRRCS